jgi:hypothetical protein
MKAKGFITVALASLMAISMAAGVWAQDKHTEAKATDWREDYAYNLGVQAYIFSFPWVYLPQLRYAWVTQPRNPELVPYMAFNHFWHSRNLTSPAYQDGGSPNNDTLYSVTWLDLSKEPVILSHPDMGDRYFTFEIASMTSDNFAYIGKRTTSGKAGNYLIAGPNWKGELPKGVQLPAQSSGTKLMSLPPTSPTANVLILGRTAVMGPKDTKVVNKLQDQYTLTPLSLWGKTDAMFPENRETWRPYDSKTDPLADWKTINRSMAENPPLAQNNLMLKQFKAIGVGPGVDVEAMDDATKRGLARAAKKGRELLAAASETGVGKVINGWNFTPNTMGSAGYWGDFLTRGAIQCLGGIISNDPEEAVYPLTQVDADGDRLTGARKYMMIFASGNMPKVDAFWSLTLYDAKHNLVANSINRYAISSNSGGYKQGADGSLMLYIQRESPGKDKEANWLPTPEGEFSLVFRTYLPAQEILDQTWEIPGLVKAK